MRDLTLYLVFGLPGAGKTTRLREIVAATDAVPLCADEWVTGLGQSLVDYGFRVKLHFLDAPLDELVRRVRSRGGPDAEILATKVLMEQSGGFEKPTAEESALFGRYLGPDDFLKAR